MRIATLGPEGTFSHEVVLNTQVDAEIIFQRTIRDIFIATEAGDADAGIAPLENSVSGTVGETQDMLTETELTVEREYIHPVVQNLAVKTPAQTVVNTIYSHPQSYSQCEKFLHEKYPEAEVILTSSNGKSAEELKLSNRDDVAAICPEAASKINELHIIHRAIQDNRYNVTRFILVSRGETSPSGYDRTSMAVYPRVDYPGLLHEMLGVLAERKVNLSKIESRPSKGKLGDYIFFMDIQGHYLDKPVADAIRILEKKSFVKILGSYRRQY